MRGIETTEMDSNRRRARGGTTARRITGSLVACLLLSAAPEAGAEEAAWIPAPDWFQEHIDFLARDGGEFRTDNTPYRSDAEPWDAYALKWEKGPSGQTVHGRLFGIRDGEASGAFWEYLIFWHPAEAEARIVQVGTGGALGLGTIEPADDEGVQRSEQTFFTPNGGFRMAHLVRNEGDVHDTQVERWVEGAWQPQRGYIWHRVREGAEEAAAAAGEDRPAAVSAACASEEHRAFDFLLGSWEVLSADGGDAGTVKVTSRAGGCVLQEEWLSPSGRVGVSLNTYSSEDGEWLQTYADSSGALLELRGTAVDEGVVLFDRSRESEGRVDRFGWFPRGDGTLRQIWERSDRQGWEPVFEAAWIPRRSAESALELSEALEPLAGLVGTWEITAIQQDAEGAWVERPSTVAQIRSGLEGKFLVEEAELDVSAGRLEFLTLIGYDPFQETYRMSWNDSLAGLADIYEGSIVDGVLVLDNLESQTFWGSPDGDTQWAFRLELDLEAPDGERRMLVHTSDDGGATWSLYQTTIYRRLAP